METLSYYQAIERMLKAEARVAELEKENKELRVDVNVYKHGYETLTKTLQPAD